MRTWTFEERRPPGDGPWVAEPDKAQWLDEETGLDCLIVRNRHGALCGYVGLPPVHPLHGKSYDEVHDVTDIQVHGSLTFAGLCQEGAEDGPGICHVPEPGRPAEVWWLGFDCGHSFDLSPGLVAIIAESRAQMREFVGLPGETYRTFEYVRGEVTSLARQLAQPEPREQLDLCAGCGAPVYADEPHETTHGQTRHEGCREAGDGL